MDEKVRVDVLKFKEEHLTVKYGDTDIDITLRDGRMQSVHLRNHPLAQQGDYPQIGYENGVHYLRELQKVVDKALIELKKRKVK